MYIIHPVVIRVDTTSLNWKSRETSARHLSDIAFPIKYDVAEDRERHVGSRDAIADDKLFPRPNLDSPQIKSRWDCFVQRYARMHFFRALFKGCMQVEWLLNTADLYFWRILGIQSWLYNCQTQYHSSKATASVLLNYDYLVSTNDTHCITLGKETTKACSGACKWR